MSFYLARTYALIGLEDLNTKGMLANHHLAQSVSDASFYEVQRQLLYKTEQHGGYVQLVSQWVCEQCGVINERDVNAPLNIRDEALRLVTDVPVVASSGQKFACGAESSGSLRVESETICDEAGTKMSLIRFTTF